MIYLCKFLSYSNVIYKKNALEFHHGPMFELHAEILAEIEYFQVYEVEASVGVEDQ